jgi:hypothetical protein
MGITLYLWVFPTQLEYLNPLMRRELEEGHVYDTVGMAMLWSFWHQYYAFHLATKQAISKTITILHIQITV